MNKLKISLSLIFYTGILSAQTQTSGSNLLFYGIVAVCAVLVVWAMLGLAGNLLKIEALKYGIDPDKAGIGIIPGVKDFISPRKPAFINEGSFHHFTKGHDILLAGAASGPVSQAEVSRFAIMPGDFHGMSPIPKVVVEIGSEIKAGDVLFYDKKRPEIQYVSPVSGEVVEIRRGDKRSVSAVVILADKTMKFKKVTAPDINSVDRSGLVEFMTANGLWPLINERPFDVVPSLTTIPSNIFISTFDTAPLAPDNNLFVDGNEDAFSKGLEVLRRLTSGKVHLGLDGRGKSIPSGTYFKAEGVEKHWFSGPHPAGNVGVHIHHIAPIKGHDKVWTLGVQEVITIGKMFLTGEYHAERIVALTGAELKHPCYVRTYQGAGLSDLLKDNVTGENYRIVSGDVLSGRQDSSDGFLSFKDDQVTVLKEGNQYELFGWLLPLSPRPSISGTIPSYGKGYKFEANTNTHGEKRAFVVSGQYESVLPMEIYPMHLFKSILANDIEKMEGLGLNELTEEDVALCEFVCTSKNPLQTILRQGLETLKEQS